MRNSRVCEECISQIKGDGSWVMGHGLKVIRHAARYGCYRDSRLYSIPLAVTNALHQSLGTLQKKVDCFIALTEFAKKKFIACGLPQEKITVKPNFLPDPPDPNYSHRGYGIYLGRISAEKGLNILINVANLIRLKLMKNIPVKIVGDGPLKDNLQQVVDTGKIRSIEFIGRRSCAESMNLLQQAQFLVLPSLCYEGFPMVIREAFACGKPVIASRLGAMADLVEDGKTGLLFEPGNPADLAEKLQWVAEHEQECIEMGKNARKVFEERYTSAINFQKVVGIYKKVMKKD
jgi:glycosyltransferase involved in cell wall biosynthesis